MRASHTSHPDANTLQRDPVERAAALRGVLRERMEETDRLARLPQSTIADLEAARLFELTTPRRYGGLQSDLHTYMDAMVELGRGDPSVSWAATLVNINNWFVSTLFPPEVSEEVFATPGTRVAAVLQSRRCETKKVPGGLMIESGVWGFNSAVHLAHWDLLGVPVPDEHGVLQYEALALIPMSDVRILDDWDTIGMRGSGSSSVSVKDVFVPDIRLARTDKVRDGIYESVQLENEWLYRAAFTPLGQIIIAFPTLGAGLAALDIFMEQLPKRAIAMTPYTKQIEAPITHLQLGEASAKIDAARVLMEKAASDIEREAKAGRLMDVMMRGRIRRDTGFADRLVWEGVDTLASACGGSFAASTHPLNRIWRDTRVGSLHGSLVPATVFELYGRLMCGLESWVG